MDAGEPEMEMTNTEIIAIVTACEDGQEIEERHPSWGGQNPWLPFNGKWRFEEMIYRIKPTPPAPCTCMTVERKL